MVKVLILIDPNDIVSGKTFNCSEQYYMYEKARFFGDTKRAKEILRCTDPKEMKRIGRQVIGFDEKRWDEVSLRVCFNCLEFMVM